MSSELNIPLANLWEAIECAMADIVQLVQVAQTTSGLTKMEAVQQLYRIMVSISNTFIHPWSIISNICYRGNGLGAMWRVMSALNAKVNTFTPILHTLLCISLIMSVAINNPPASAKSNAECFGNVDFSLINLKSMAEKHIYYYKGMYHIYSTHYVHVLTSFWQATLLILYPCLPTTRLPLSLKHLPWPKSICQFEWAVTSPWSPPSPWNP